MELNLSTVHSVFQSFRRELHSIFEDKEIDQFLYLILDAWFGWSKVQVHINLNHPFTVDDRIRFKSALSDLKVNKPIQYIIGVVSFCNLDLLVNSDVLIPRPETEQLVQLIISENLHRQFEEFSVLDIGAGSGNIGLSIKKQLPFTRVSLMDVSESSLNIAQANAERNNCQVEIIKCDILDMEQWKSISNYQIMISNPPYVMEVEKNQMQRNVLDYEPALALFVPDKDPLLYYKAIAEFSIRHLTPPGLLYFEINERFGNEIKKLLTGSGFEKVETIRDFYGKDRFVRAELRTSMLDTSYWHVEH